MSNKVERATIKVTKAEKPPVERKRVPGVFQLKNMLSPSLPNHVQPVIDSPAEPQALQRIIDDEVDSIGALIAANRARSEARDAIIDDTGFYFTVVFQTTEQKLAFLELAGWLGTFDDENYNNQFVNGLEIARRMGIDIQAADLPELYFRGNPSKIRKEVIYSGTKKDSPSG